MYLNITSGLVLKHKIVVCIAITKTVETCAAAAETLVTVS